MRINKWYDFIYPTQADAYDNEWLRDMLRELEASGLPYLCFPFADIYPKYFIENTPQNDQFWLFMWFFEDSCGNWRLIPYKRDMQLMVRK